MKLGAVTYNLLKDLDVEGIIKVLEATRFEAVELRTTHKHGVEPSLSADERRRVRERFQNSKVRLLSYGTTCEFHSPDAAVRRKNVEIAKQFIDLAHDTAAWGIKVRPNALPKEVPVETTIRNMARACGKRESTAPGKAWKSGLKCTGGRPRNRRFALTS